MTDTIQRTNLAIRPLVEKYVIMAEVSL